MTDLETLGARVDHLEMRFAHQDHVIDELNNTITEQWKHIDALTRRLVALGDRVQEAAVNAGSSAPEPPPPHY
ncbi:SlyX family protein [Microvirga antarctica]|uniref:SlyX family protein n=1 Tax=Microvirga antarctica TaxID=2819233 RepID=UPI0031BAD466